MAPATGVAGAGVAAGAVFDAAAVDVFFVAVVAAVAAVATVLKHSGAELTSEEEV